MSQPNQVGGIPPRPPSQLALGWIAAGVLVGALLVFGLVVLGGALEKDGFAAEWVLFPIFYAPPIIGIALVALPGPWTRRSFGAGFMMGWGAGIIVSSGLCFVGVINTPFPIAG